MRFRHGRGHVDVLPVGFVFVLFFPAFILRQFKFGCGESFFFPTTETEVFFLGLVLPPAIFIQRTHSQDDVCVGYNDDFLPFRDVINEYYAKDISKKIKSTFKAKGESGKRVASSPPYGYLKDSEDNNKWVIDEVAAPIVRRIF